MQMLPNKILYKTNKSKNKKLQNLEHGNGIKSDKILNKAKI